MVAGETTDRVLPACRATVGDDLRSVGYFTPHTYEQLYLREDLEADADLTAFVENERLGFRSQRAYGGTELGSYEFTIRSFERGYITRVIEGEEGVFVTTDRMPMERFEDLGTALREVLG